MLAQRAVSNGKKIRQFPTLKGSEAFADEVERLLSEHGKNRLDAFACDPVPLQEKLTAYGKAIADAVVFNIRFFAEQAENEESETLGNSSAARLAEKRREQENGTLRFDLRSRLSGVDLWLLAPNPEG